MVWITRTGRLGILQGRADRRGKGTHGQDLQTGKHALPVHGIQRDAQDAIRRTQETQRII